MITIIGIIITIVAVVGVVLNARRLRACFYWWIVSNSGSLGVHVYAAIVHDQEYWPMVLRDAIFLGLAFYGLACWKRKVSDVG